MRRLDRPAAARRPGRDPTPHSAAATPSRRRRASPSTGGSRSAPTSRRSRGRPRAAARPRSRRARSRSRLADGRHLLPRSRRLADEALEPLVQVVLALAPLERAHARLPLAVVHRQRGEDRFGDRVDVVRVHPDRLDHRLGGARHPREHEHARRIGAAGHELLGDQVHAVAQRRDEADRGVSVERGEAPARDRAVDVADRGPRGVPETTVDPTDELVDRAFLVLVLR